MNTESVSETDREICFLKQIGKSEICFLKQIGKSEMCFLKQIGKSDICFLKQTAADLGILWKWVKMI